MKFLRHVGKHGDRKIAVVFREVPGEPHMTLVVYTELLNQNIHDPLIQCIESDIGQSSESLSDALNRSYTKDGKILLQVLHAEGMLKKVRTELVVMTPQPNISIKLDELNKILNEMQQGEAATKRLEEMDKSLGLQDPRDVVRRMGGKNLPEAMKTAQSPLITDGALNDNQIANNLRMQAEKMNLEARGLMAEADRLLKEAASMDPVATVQETKPKKTTTRKTKVNA